MKDSDRERRIAFDQNYCEHYAPKPGSVMHDYCSLGCDASKRMEEARISGEPNMTPCIGGHTTPNVLNLCPKWQRRSIERSEERADAIERSIKRMAIASPFISEWRKKQPIGKNELVGCPICNGRLHLSQSSYNGHVRACCETKNCINFIE